MKLTIAFKEDVLALLEHTRKVRAARGAEYQADSTVSKKCFGHGEFVAALRKWNGGPKSPTLEKVGEFEEFLRADIGDEEYQKFLKSRNRT